MIWRPRRLITRPTKKAVQAAIAAQAPPDIDCNDCCGSGVELSKEPLTDITDMRPCMVCNGTGRVAWIAPVREKKRRKVSDEELPAVMGWEVCEKCGTTKGTNDKCSCN